ncbi:MAG TPA: DNA-binding protein, partial [Leptospiraceae bacterium]|nr:DNA-binding protein [Leptospiraceae bacterium]
IFVHATNNNKYPQKLEKWSGRKGSFADAAKFGEILVLSVKGSQFESAIKTSGIENFAGKTVIDVNNPIADEPPVNGVLKFFTGPNDSLLEKIQAILPKSNLVKAFSCVGSPHMVNPEFPGGKPSMFICGNSENAKTDVKEILDKFGWETEDMGKAEAARAIEPLCILWCIPGLSQGSWMHAFKLLKK